ncbi:MAG: type VI secretion protein [Burkholderiales bacterium]
MNDRDEIKKKIRAGNFVENNGRVIRVINVLRHKYNKLSSIKYALPELQEDELLDSINYMFEAGYIHLRDIETKAGVPTELADADYRQLEAKLTDKGIQLLAFGIKDPLVKV